MAITHGLPFADYLKLPGLSASALKTLMRSPMNYRWKQDHPNHESTPAQILGTAAHTAILEPHRLKTDYVLWNEGTRRGKAWDEFKAMNAGRSILTSDEYESVKGMHRSMRGFAPAMRYLEQGRAEATMQWKMGGRLFKGRADWLTTIDGRPVIGDLKTTRDGRPFNFGADAFRLGYHIQFALYCDGFHVLAGELPRFVVLVVENQPPFEPAVFEVPDEVIELGREEYTRLVKLLNECEAANHWPPACEAEQRLNLPKYAYEQEDNDISELGLTA